WIGMEKETRLCLLLAASEVWVKVKSKPIKKRASSRKNALETTFCIDATDKTHYFSTEVVGKPQATMITAQSGIVRLGCPRSGESYNVLSGITTDSNPSWFEISLSQTSGKKRKAIENEVENGEPTKPKPKKKKKGTKRKSETQRKEMKYEKIVLPDSVPDLLHPVTLKVATPSAVLEINDKDDENDEKDVLPSTSEAMEENVRDIMKNAADASIGDVLISDISGNLAEENLN